MIYQNACVFDESFDKMSVLGHHWSVDPGRVFELDALARNQVRSYPRRRYLYDELVGISGRPFIALVGPRGTGKTVLLRQLRGEDETSLYVSADTLDRDTDLFELARVMSEGYGIVHLYVDEIHFLANYQRDLKKIHDFLDVAVWLRSSVSLALTAAGWDLSRRVRRVRLWPFSLREYIDFSQSTTLPRLRLADALTGQLSPRHLRHQHLFSPYLAGGLYPFMLQQGATIDLFGSILDKVVASDIPNFDRSLSAQDLDDIRKTVQFIGSSAVDGINYSTVSRNVGITKYKAEKFLAYLERSFLITRVFPAGTNVLKEPKVLMQLPYRLLYTSRDSAMSATREDFFALAMHQHAVAFHYAKTTRGGKTPDFIVDLDGRPTIFEIGGRGKGRSQFKGVEYERKIVLFDGGIGGMQPDARVPLFCIGFA